MKGKFLKPQLVFVGGSGRSGSTLLDLLLNNNQHIQSVGEVHRLGWYARTNHEACTCGEPVASCPFWHAVEEEARRSGVSYKFPLGELDMMLRPEDLSGLGNAIEKALLVLGSRILFLGWIRVFARQHAAALRNSKFWYETIRRTTGKPVIVDSTKDARRLKALYLYDPSNFKLIYLVRDGRAVSASAIRREGCSMSKAASAWASANRRSLTVRRGIPAARIMDLRYEDLCNSPGETLASVCSFLEVPYSAEMLVLRKVTSHNIGGNPMRFRQDETGIVLDERWKDQLTAADLDEFDKLAGNLNRHFGYD